MTSSIVVLGAGVSGLTTALLLKKSNPNSKVTVVAQFLPGDLDITYTSPFAGANWHTFSDDDDYVLQEFDKPGYSKFLELANEPKSGVWIKKSFAYLTENTFKAEYNSDQNKFFKWYKNFVKDFTIVDKSSFPHQDIALGFSFTGVVITVPIYLNYLLSECLSSGVNIKRTKKFDSIDQVKNFIPNTDLVINCTGLLATRLKGISDPKRNYPVRGQVLLVSNNAPNKVSVSMDHPDYPNELLYCMPRKEGGCILGGCIYPNDSNPNPDDELTRRICERAIKYIPELVDPKYGNNSTTIDIVKVNVGLRPARKGGARVESDPENPWLIHNYGAGGGGYQGSYGFSAKVVQLVQQKQREVRGKL
ncbi:putative D-amino-acid oxidase [[Candida] railenensis]|uniref:D-amino-acid oxidase n=1 Tax=[Candida] railenensis TaxID=45579 RepID=A0A9P0VVY3_9ASCO|nr:putative D-amino-acid oxidase [[Candida] railenensis]